jgi:PAS domain S-box-containing protein
VAAFGPLSWPDYFSAVLAFWIGDWAGILILTPFLLAFVIPGGSALMALGLGPNAYAKDRESATGHWSVFRTILEALALAVSIVLVLWLAFGTPIAGSFHLLYLCFLPIAWIAWRHGLPGATVGILTINAGAILAVRMLSFKGYSLVELQILMLVLSLSGLFLGTAISERRWAEKALRESELKFRLVTETIKDVFWMSTCGVGEMVYISPAYEALWERSRESLYQSPRSFVEAIHPDDLDEYLGVLGEYHKNGKPYECDYRIIRRDGEVRWIYEKGYPVPHSPDRTRLMTGVCTDITERKRVEEALQQSEERLRTVTAASADYIMMLDTDLKVRYINRTEPGLTKDDVLGQPLYLLVKEGSRRRVRKQLESVLETGQSASYETIYERPGGTRVTFESHATVTRIGTLVTGVVVVSRNITERVRAQETLRRSLEETAHNQRLLLALSQAAQAVQRARTAEEVYRIVGDQIAALGHQAAIFEVTEDRAHLALLHTTFKPQSLRAAEKLSGISVQGYRFRLTPGGFYQHIIDEAVTVHSQEDDRPFLEALPPPVRSMASRLGKLFDWQPNIFAPLRAGGETLGLLVVMGGRLRENDRPAIATFANQAAITIENVQLLAQVRDDHEQMQVLSRRLVVAQETERSHIARELHDQIGQILIGLNLLLEISVRAPADLVKSRLDEARDLVEELMSRVDQMSLDLRPALLDDLGLLPALMWHVKRYTTHTGVDVRMEHTGIDQRFSSQIETTAYRIVQEGLTNVARHSGASEAIVRLWCDEHTLGVQVADRGMGFDPRSASDGSGLSGMRERARLLGGQMTVESTPGGGTWLTVELPLGGEWNEETR